MHTESQGLLISFQENFKKEAIIEDFKMFCAFCKYPNLSRSILNKNLSCRYKRDLPFLQLSPLKLEELNLDPPVLLFHEAISEGDIQFVKDAAIPSVSYCTNEVNRISTNNSN